MMEIILNISIVPTNENKQTTFNNMSKVPTKKNIWHISISLEYLPNPLQPSQHDTIPPIPAQPGALHLGTQRVYVKTTSRMEIFGVCCSQIRRRKHNSKTLNPKKNIIYIYIRIDISWILFFFLDPKFGEFFKNITEISYRCCPPLLPKDCSDWQVQWYPSRLLRPSMPMVVSHSDSRGDSPKGVAWITCNDNICVHMHIYI